MKVLPIICLILAGCSVPAEPPEWSPEQHTGPVMVMDVSVGYCLPAVGEKSGTSVCDRTITVRKPDGVVYQIGLQRSGAWPPVYKGEQCDIHFQNHNPQWGSYSKILWVQELK